ncbi:hypothetical protein ACUTR7_00790 [Delftia sp. NA_296.1]|uniref:Uncharacterized protein n=4 Tax=Pseudomonadati TaxID=3379134 RepID=A0A2M9PU42_DELAC|nr:MULTISPECIES: hypothetical protein [Delftia]KAA9174480.1 hypothetical protein F3K36_14145 [Delftia sp. BR1]EPD45159.1 hypothetical protein HMPREF9702_01500 [Delftia acidovorans CCUG 15835]EZP52754.1 hypothetical protein BW39_03263 [Delftia sp. RIT313]KZK31456.1 hypothetical protein A4F85_01595 [Delftia sp. GW456-R20]MCA1069003.1 hypothetical protein [Delftia acidovorans]
MATPNYAYEKRQRELAKKQKKLEKEKAKAEKRPDDHEGGGSEGNAQASPAAARPGEEGRGS